ncbi:ABC transporter permease subunit [Halalkalibacter urbisdiaboli]|uniref:ABC transporter permease subunit n=1 Tax=Halalkalibacter urbisdiaboli TaxID=1960589 RepID=UPI000B44813F|nr:hypothetical protein [Halalkalibacter urbisdiaboli]
MHANALLQKEWKQGKIMLLMVGLLLLFHYPIRAIIAIEDWREAIKQDYFMPHSVPEFFGPSMPGMLAIIFIVLLAVQFIGTERNTRKHDFSFALPFSRRSMLFTKWALGAGFITVFMFVFSFIAFWLIRSSEFSAHLEGYNLLSFVLLPWLGYLATYTFALFIGTITGEMISQIALTFIFIVFPFGIFVLINHFTDLHFRSYIHPPNIFELLIWPLYVIKPYTEQDLATWWIPALAIIILILLSQWLYERNDSEYNGEFLIFKQLQAFFRFGILTCFALLGGMIVSGLVPYTLSDTTKIIFYWSGAFLFMFLSYLMTRRLFTMNIMFKGK